VPMSRAVVRVPDGQGGAREVRVVDVHTLPPRNAEYFAVWERQMRVLERLIARERGALVVAGDFNATPQARAYRRLVAARMRGAHEDRGRGLAVTWPNGLFPVPSVRFDHVLLSPEVACLRVHEAAGIGSDHSPVVADLALLR